MDTEDPNGGAFEADGVYYAFHRKGSDYRLTSFTMSEGCTLTTLRDIRVGDSIESVLSKIPARDRELKRWAEQALYGSGPDDPDGYARLEFVAGSYYSLSIYTYSPYGSEGCCVGIVFDRSNHVRFIALEPI